MGYPSQALAHLEWVLESPDLDRFHLPCYLWAISLDAHLRLQEARKKQTPALARSVADRVAGLLERAPLDRSLAGAPASMARLLDAILAEGGEPALAAFRAYADALALAEDWSGRASH